MASFMARIVERIDKEERNLGKWGAALATGCILLGLAMICVAPELRVKHLGYWYAQISEDPFLMFHIDNSGSHRVGITDGVNATGNEFRSRFVTPFVGWALHLRGANFIFVPLIFSVLLLGAVYLVGRSRGLSNIESVGLAALLAFSSPVLTLLQFPGYVDTTSYLLLLIAFLLVKTPYWYIPFGISLFNHESGVFLAPALLFLSVGDDRSPRRIATNVLLLCAAVAPMYLFHKWLQARGLMPFNEGYYLNPANIVTVVDLTGRYVQFGIFQGFKLFWFFPIAAMWIYGSRREWSTVIALALMILGPLAQLLMATDTSRLIGLAFPSIIFGALLFRDRDPASFPKWLFALIGLNLLVPQFYVAQCNAMPMLSTPWSMFLWCVGRCVP